MEVADVLRDRINEPSGFERMAVVSVLAHAALFALLILMPGGFLSRSEPPPRTVMTITLAGGNGGPANGGVTSIGGRAVQAEQPEPPKRPEPVTAPAPKTPEMTVPIPSKTPARTAKPAPVVKQAPEQSRGRTPTKGAEAREGSAIAETGARGLGFGLTTSGGMGTGSRLDVDNFCCPDYIVLMVQKIRGNWNSRAEATGHVFVKYTILRDGTISNAEIEKSSGYTALDINALRAVVGTRQLPPLPDGYPNPTLGVHLDFDYTR